MLNPSTLQTHTWQTRPSFQDRLTIYSASPRRVICTLLHSDRVADRDLQLITAAPALVAALQLAELALEAQARTAPDAETLMASARDAIRLALDQAGMDKRAQLFTNTLFTL